MGSSQCDKMLKLKVAQLFSKVAQNIAKSIFILKGTFFKIAQKSLYIWATFETKCFTQNLRKSPKLVTVEATNLCLYYLLNFTYQIQLQALFNFNEA